MNWSLSLLLTAVAIGGTNNVGSIECFNSYTKAHRNAHRMNKPMLVILNPTTDADVNCVSLADVKKTRHRRDLLKQYVVAVIDTGTKHGKIVHGLFGNKQLPRVVVIDREQKWQLFQTNQSLQGEDWNRILETFRDGDPNTSLDLRAAQWCPT